jgi:tyrosyl-tRNA synthetase
MSTHSSTVRRTFRLSVDIETVLKTEADETTLAHPEQARFHRALVQQLLARPTVLAQYQRAEAVTALKSAQKLFAAEFGWDRVSEQQLLQSLVEKLEPAAQAYFTEELEDGVTIYYFDGCQTTIKDFNLTELS